MRAQSAVVFTPVYPENSVSQVSDETLDRLSLSISDGNAYSAIVNNLGINNPDEFDGVTTIAIVGQQPFRLFPSLGGGYEAPCVLFGSKLDRGSGSVHFRGLTINRYKKLPENATWFDPNVSGINLDHVQIILLRVTDLGKLHTIEKEELVTKAVFLNPSENMLFNYTQSAASSQLYLIPENLASAQSARFNGIMKRASLYILAMIAFSGLAMFIYTAIMREIIRDELRSFIIRRMCGASQLKIRIRIVTYVAMTSILIPTMVCLFLLQLGAPIDKGAQVMLFIIAGIFVVWLIYAIRMVNRMEHVK